MQNSKAVIKPALTNYKILWEHKVDFNTWKDICNTVTFLDGKTQYSKYVHYFPKHKFNAIIIKAQSLDGD